MNKQDFKKYINSFDFTALFNHLGWAFIKDATPIKAGDETYTLLSIAEKSGFRILVCQPDKNGMIPLHPIRLKIDNQVGRLFKEHMVIFVNKANTQQVWQTLQKEINKPPKLFTVNWHKGQEPELLYQKASGLIFTLDEEDNITIVDVTRRVAENFQANNEKITKQFYERFKKEHTSFLSFIRGINAVADKDWYASLMLNRLMFCYFIQKKGFLDQSPNYLREKLKACQDKKGKDKFYSFYRSFLLLLFHEGLNRPLQKEKVKIEIGRIPYLNGGLFDEHELEKSYDIDIDDIAFERLFDFFDQFEWHLDTRVIATGKDINPDVIGYIFEKYINDRATMGAYYTKEDITDYISKNCILPWLHEHTANRWPASYSSEGEIWSFFQASSDFYIDKGVKHGVNEKLPIEIEAGISDVTFRTDWNSLASSNIGLATETWRETIDRRKKYNKIKEIICAGSIKSIDDFIIFNLNIREFSQHVIEATNDADFLFHFYTLLNAVTVIDPTCGSGAFLFAAMNILEPLYHACITRMRSFIEDEDRVNEENKKVFSDKYRHFRTALADIQNLQHPNTEYYIYKTIILKNLHGVDIMKEAVEIAKLRLFLKLVSTVEADFTKPNFGMEPLPDIDFNIRAGNTLIGFTNFKDLEKLMNEDLEAALMKSSLIDKCELVKIANKNFKEIQLSNHSDFVTFTKGKKKLEQELNILNRELNTLLHKQAGKIGFEKWLSSHHPFNWFAEFYEIMQEKNGFDVIIGNPPYVEYKDVKEYKVNNFVTEKCSNLFSFIIERCFGISHQKSEIGMIIPLSAFSTDRMIPLIDMLKKNAKFLYNANFSWRPGRLFEGVNLQLSILLVKIGQPLKQIQSTRYIMWNSDTRSDLFSKIEFANVDDKRLQGSIPKLGNMIAVSVLHKIRDRHKELATCFTKQSNNLVYYRRGGLYWKVFVDFATHSSEEKIIKLLPEVNKYAVIAALSSSLWWWYYTTTSDCRHLGNRDFETFPFDPREMDVDLLRKLVTLGKKYVEDLKKNAENTVRVYKKKNSVEVISFRVNQSKPIIDQIDGVLAKHFRFTEEEFDFLSNYDVKYRMGKELDEDEN